MIDFIKTKFIKIAIVFLLIFQTSCGYVFYPERRNQKGAKEVDLAIVALDAIGLLFFVVPGVIAFAVDISTNTIYFPRSHSRYSSLDDSLRDFSKLEVSDEKLRLQIAEIVKEKTGKELTSEDEILVFSGK
jgi:hypothetical protein